MGKAIGLALWGIMIGASSTVSAADLEVRVSGTAHERGSVHFNLYNGPDGFRHEEKSFRTVILPAAVGTVAARFEGVEPGRYAVIVYHDENSDGTINRFLGMIPTEGYGLSNNPKVMGPPGFDDSAFELPAEGASVDIQFNY